MELISFMHESIRLTIVKRKKHYSQTNKIMRFED